MRLRLGTRGSRLARTQSAGVAALLAAHGHEVELFVIKTAGDQQQGVPFEQIGAPGVFVRELESALLEERVDLAVHSYKDLPSKGPAELTVAAVPGREDARDLLFVRGELVPTDGPLPLARGARVGTASARRRALVGALRPDLELAFLRGNVPTRLRKLREGVCDAILLAAAGVRRLEAERGPGGPGGDVDEPLDLSGLASLALDPELFVPAPAQGALALQVRAADAAARAAVARLDDARAHRGVRAERALLARVEGNCTLPFGALCRPRAGGGDELELLAVLGTPAGLVRVRERGADPLALAEACWRGLAPALEALR